MNGYIVYEERSTEYTIQDTFGETEKDIYFIIWLNQRQLHWHRRYQYGLCQSML